MADKHRTQSPLCVMLTVKDMKKSVPFYRDQLGFEIAEAWPDRDNPMWANLTLAGQSIMLGAAMSSEDMGDCGGGDAGAQKKALYEKAMKDFRSNKPGVGVIVYVTAENVDEYHKRVRSKGVKPITEPTTEFYGIRDFLVEDPDGYQLMFFQAVAMTTCQSCGMPLKDAKAGQMYCGYCTDASGTLKPYEAVYEGTVSGYFMGMQKMQRPAAEKAAREHLSKMPAWAGRK
jgi:uncharacterized glyoxalase superfamily protein PhnB